MCTFLDVCLRCRADRRQHLLDYLDFNSAILPSCGRRILTHEESQRGD